MIRSRRLLAAVALVVTAIGTSVSAQDFSPRDECSKIEGATEFRSALSTAVDARDADALLALVTDDILLDFGGGSGKAELRKRLTDTNYNLWSELPEILKLGCASDDGSRLSLPWYFNQEMGNIDPFEGYLVTGSRVALRAGPSLNSKVVTRISWQPVVLVRDGANERTKFMRVQGPDGQTGFMHRDYLRSFIDYRIQASQQDGRWLATVFIAGD
ncbi:SH3 domain-containing protein [Altererythrobacter sp. ZODW24]|uniref:SH3 domain-containing protein n=1 Tax=Altererythrobacter sp. ZODW24 TaxID=2185142 RepID=UPI0013B3C3F1|nr:SH3 domain-containing protein [Altererythrobacter sp. ZODW24]